MKRSLITLVATLSALSTSIFAVPVLANDIVRVNSFTPNNLVKISPFNLVTGGYQGLFKAQGIPSSASFVMGIRNNKITAEDLVKSAIAQGRLSEDTIDDTSYLNEVQFVMDGLDRN